MNAEAATAAVRKGDLEALARWKEAGGDVNVLDDDGELLLNTACIWGRVGVVQWLIANGANVNETKTTHPLILACTLGRTAVASALLAADADVNVKNADESSALHVACDTGRVDMVKLLLLHGARVDEEEKSVAGTPLYMSCSITRTDVARVLIAAGAEVNKPNKNGATALHVASQMGAAELVELLLDSGALVTHATTRGDTPLHLAAHMGSAEVIPILLRRGAQIDAGNQRGKTPFVQACCSNRLEAAKVLRDNGAAIAIKYRGKRTALHGAARRGAIGVVPFLVEMEFNVNEEDANGKRPLQLACRWGHTATALALIDLGADMHAACNFNVAPLYLACESGVPATVRALAKRGASAVRLLEGFVMRFEGPLREGQQRSFLATLFAACPELIYDEQFPVMLNRAKSFRESFVGEELEYHRSCIRRRDVQRSLLQCARVDGSSVCEMPRELLWILMGWIRDLV